MCTRGNSVIITAFLLLVLCCAFWISFTGEDDSLWHYIDGNVLQVSLLPLLVDYFRYLTWMTLLYQATKKEKV